MNLFVLCKRMKYDYSLNVFSHIENIIFSYVFYGWLGSWVPHLPLYQYSRIASFDAVLLKQKQTQKYNLQILN